MLKFNIMEFKLNDGGRVAAGFINDTNDCVARAFALAVPCCNYGLARALVSHLKDAEGVNVYGTEFMQLMARVGFVYAPTHVGKVSDLPQDGVFIAHTQKHVSAILDGEVNDVIDPREETLKGYWLRKSAKGYHVLKGAEQLNRWPLNFNDALKMVSNYSFNYDRSTLLTIIPIL